MTLILSLSCLALERYLSDVLPKLSFSHSSAGPSERRWMSSGLGKLDSSFSRRQIRISEAPA
jgi:hypothetical protein